MGHISQIIRPLNRNDVTAYRKLRQRILHSEDAQFFSSSYELERQLTESQWLAWCTETPAHCILGTFIEHELVGIIMITRQGAAVSRLLSGKKNIKEWANLQKPWIV